MAQAAMAVPPDATVAEMEQAMDEAAVVIEAARPTAQNLFYAVQNVKAAASAALSTAGGTSESAQSNVRDRFAAAAVAAAQAIADDDAACCKAIGEHGVGLFEQHGTRVSTHCNAGTVCDGHISACCKYAGGTARHLHPPWQPRTPAIFISIDGNIPPPLC